MAKSLLVKDEFALQLWNAGNEHPALVYDLLLALDRRIYLKLNHLSPNKSEWRVMLRVLIEPELRLRLTNHTPHGVAERW